MKQPPPSMSDLHLHLCNCMHEHALVPKGWWAQWCVNHDSALYEFGAVGGDVCDDVRSGSIGFCVWHPQGAFIPEVDA